MTIENTAIVELAHSFVTAATVDSNQQYLISQMVAENAEKKAEQPFILLTDRIVEECGDKNIKGRNGKDVKLKNATLSKVRTQLNRACKKLELDFTMTVKSDNTHGTRVEYKEVEPDLYCLADKAAAFVKAALENECASQDILAAVMAQLVEQAGVKPFNLTKKQAESFNK